MTPATDPRRAVDRIARWSRELTTTEVVELCCAEAAPPPVEPPHRLVQLPACLTRLGPADLAELVAAAPNLVIHVRGCLGSGLTRTLDELQVLLDGLGVGERLRVADMGSQAGSAAPATARATGSAAGTDKLPLSRRQLFGWVRRSQEEQSGPSEDTASIRGPSGETIRLARTSPSDPDDRGEALDQMRLAAALRELSRQRARNGPPPEAAGRGPEGAAGGQPGIGASRALQLSSDGCTACSTCVRACPTQALSLGPLAANEQVSGTGQHDAGPSTAGARPPTDTDTAGVEVVLALEPAACIGCRQCVALCPVQAITSGETVPWTDLAQLPAVQELERVRVRPCTSCRAPFAGDGDLCQVCRMRKENPFGSWLPPGYVAPRVYAPPPEG